MYIHESLYEEGTVIKAALGLEKKSRSIQRDRRKNVRLKSQVTRNEDVSRELAPVLLSKIVRVV